MAGRTVREAMWDERREWIRKQSKAGCQLLNSVATTVYISGIFTLAEYASRNSTQCQNISPKL
jgi:hypothetical protein